MYAPLHPNSNARKVVDADAGTPAKAKVAFSTLSILLAGPGIYARHAQKH